MKTAAEKEFRRPGLLDAPDLPWTQQWYGRLVLLSLSVALLTLSFAPIKQFYLAWIGLAPWLVVISRCRSYKSAAFWGWLSGTAFFIANMWWMAYVTFPGMVGLMAILAAYWGVMGIIVRAVLGPLNRSHETTNALGAIVVTAFAWSGLEFIRGNFIWKGLPWLYLGHTQTPVLVMCQVADCLGVYGVTFWLILINATLAVFAIGGFHVGPIRRALPVVAAVTALFLVYGVWRMKSTALQPGPVVMVVQSNYPQSNSGQKGASQEEIVQFHYQTTKAALLAHPEVDLVVWSETMMPEMNPEFRGTLIQSEYPSLREWGKALYKTTDMLKELCFTFRTGLITGGRYVGDWKVVSEHMKMIDTRNAVYFYERSGLQSDLRYDKIHIVPFGEFIPFKESFPWLYRLMVSLGPPDMEDYQLNGGDEENLAVFPLRKSRDPLDLSTWRFVAPVCFEDIDSDLTARMFRPGADGTKRADFLVNLTNDGWFKANENSQHVQAASFRSIENRVATARSVNTGVSGFIDSVGRVHDTVPTRTDGTAIAQIFLDPRITFYTRYGDAFAWLCVAATASAMVLKIFNARKSRATT